MTEGKKQKSILADLLMDLKSKDSTVLLKALKRVRSKGNETVIPSIIKIIETSQDSDVVNEAKSIILELKSTKSIPFLLDELENENHEIRELVLSAFWQTGFNPHQYIDKFVKCGINGTFVETIEVYTIIDSLEGPFEEETIMEAQIMLNQYFNNNIEITEKHELLRSIKNALENYALSI